MIGLREHGEGELEPRDVMDEGRGAAARTWRRRLRRFGLVAAALAVVLGTAGAFAVTRGPVSESSRVPGLTILTAPVESRVLVSTVITRGVVGTSADTPVSCFPSSVESSVKVFTKSAQSGAPLDEGDLLAAVNGRPVFVLKGKIPAFRPMLPGAKGDDVRQLQTALARLGYSIKDPAGYLGASTQAAVRKWYLAKGFAPTGPTLGEASALSQARDSVSAAESGAASAKAALSLAKAGPARSAVLMARLAVSEAERSLREATTGAGRRRAKAELDIARAQYAELMQIPDLSALRAAVTLAERSLTRAREDVRRLATSTGFSVPFCEVVFVSRLPATVSSVTQSDPGEATIEGAIDSWATLASGGLRIQAEVSEADGSLIAKGAVVKFRAESDTVERGGSVASITESGGLMTLQIAPDEPLPESERGQNVRVSVTVTSTAGQVLAVPLAAISGTTDGLAKVTKVTPSGNIDVKVRAGLSADGYVEVVPVEAGGLNPGDPVVIGQ